MNGTRKLVRGALVPILALGCAAFPIACGGEPAVDEEGEAGMADTMEMEAGGDMMLADFAGTWRMRGTTEAGDSVPEFTMTATADRSGWTTTFPGRDPLPTRVVTAGGDSVVTEVGPYESILRDGVRVTTRVVSHLTNDRIQGTFVARYQTTGADSVTRGRVTGSRSP